MQDLLLLTASHVSPSPPLYYRKTETEKEDREERPKFQPESFVASPNLRLSGGRSFSSSSNVAATSLSAFLAVPRLMPRVKKKAPCSYPLLVEKTNVPLSYPRMRFPVTLSGSCPGISHVPHIVITVTPTEEQRDYYLLQLVS